MEIKSQVFWQTIKSRLPNHNQFLHWWVLGTVFIIPLLIFNYGFSASIIRQLVLLVLVIIGLLLWASRVIFKKEPILWWKSVFGLSALILLVAVLIASLIVPDLQQVWGLRGGLGESNPLGWLGVLGLGLLIVQTTNSVVRNYRISEFRKGIIEPPKFRNSVPLLISYLSSSTILALFVIGWFAFRQELVMPAWTSFAAASLFFTVNAMVAAAQSLGERGGRKLVWLAILLIHLAVIFAYDYDVSWYILAGGILILSVAQLVWEKKLEAVDFKVPFALIVISIGLLFAPVQSLSDKLGFSAQGGPASGWDNSVVGQVSYPRFFKYNNWRELALGHGLGRGAEAFWQKAELVDMSQVRQYPPLGNLFGALLWEGGLVLLLAWLGALVLILLAFWRIIKKTSGQNLHLALTLALGFIGYAVILLILPFDWFGLFGLIVFLSLLAVSASTTRSRRNLTLPSPWKGEGILTQGERSFISFGAVVLVVFLILLVTKSGEQIKSRLDFFDSISAPGPAGRGTTVDLRKLDKVIAGQLPTFGYRLARVDFVVQALTERVNTGQPIKDEEIKPWLEMLVKDYDWLKNEPISGAAAWQLGKSAISIGRQDKNGVADWLKRAEENFGRAIEKLPRNVILFTEVARFYRLNYGNPLQPEYLARAKELTERALFIDNSYQPAQMERAELLVLLGKTDEALESIKQVASQNPAASYSAGRLAFSAKKYDEAVNYYRKTIAQNPNHLQARYELVQALMALSDTAGAKKELEALAGLVPKDDAQTQAVIKGLGELLK